VGFLGKVKESFRDKTRDNVCNVLQSIGADAQMAERGRSEEEIGRDVEGDNSKGVIDIEGGPIRWVNITTKHDGETVLCRIMHGVPDSRLTSQTNQPSIIPDLMSGDLRWHGEDYGLELLSRLNDDSSLRDMIMKRNLTKARVVGIQAYNSHGCWVISTDGYFEKSEELWTCCQVIAQHLLADQSAR
jgi:hypothetical protein